MSKEPNTASQEGREFSQLNFCQRNMTLKMANLTLRLTLCAPPTPPHGGPLLPFHPSWQPVHAIPRVFAGSCTVSVLMLHRASGHQQASLPCLHPAHYPSYRGRKSPGDLRPLFPLLFSRSFPLFFFSVFTRPPRGRKFRGAVRVVTGCSCGTCMLLHLGRGTKKNKKQ